mmetsp:Transcript_17691/g.58244  ORF Transcript_17691/g.58244 Transcript_17691/m.58244 type:complete len:103 (-) Transcript_17691:1246-1554(-)
MRTKKTKTKTPSNMKSGTTAKGSNHLKFLNQADFSSMTIVPRAVQPKILVKKPGHAKSCGPRTRGNGAMINSNNSSRRKRQKAGEVLPEGVEADVVGVVENG